jgi:hypothetical protein
MTTSQLRQIAREAEQKLNWAFAAACYEEAIANYPPISGALTQLDLHSLSQKAKSCRYMAALEAA